MLMPLLTLLVAQGDAQPPTARVDFPLPTALTDAPAIRVRGSAADPSGVAAVRVNGVPASTADGFATWWAVVPLDVGENALVVETLDAAGNLDPAATTTVVRRDEVLLESLGYVTVDSPGGFAYVLDQARDTPSTYPYARVTRVDLESGAMSVVSSRSVGSGPLSNMNTGMGELAWDAQGGRLLVTNAHPGELHAIDVTTGDRSVLVGPGVGTGPPLDYCWALELDPTGPRAWVLRGSSSSSSQGEGQILEVDLTTGDRTVVASEDDGAQPWPFIFGTLELTPDGEHLAFADDWTVSQVELATGAQSTLSDASPGFGGRWGWLTIGGLAFDAAGRGWVSSWLDGVVYTLDPVSGVHAPLIESPLRSTAGYVDLEVDQRRGRLLALDDYNAAVLGVPHDGSAVEVVARNSIGGGYSLGKRKTHALAPEGDARVWLLDTVRAEVVSVDLADGQRTLVSGPDLGAGTALELPGDAVFDDSGAASRLLVLDGALSALLGVDPVSGDRTVLSGQGVGAGVPFSLDAQTWDLKVDRLDGTAYVLDFGGGLYERRLVAVDLATGDRTLVSGDGVGSGPLLIFGNDMVLDGQGGRALVAGNSEVFAVDLASGARSELSGPNAGAGPALSGVECLAWDAQEQRLLVVGGNGSVFDVDPATGDRALLYERDHAVGPGFSYGLQAVSLLRPAPDAAPLLVYTDYQMLGVGALDLSVDPATGTAPGHHAILSR